jgi:hypothetical protein
LQNISRSVASSWQAADIQSKNKARWGARDHGLDFRAAAKLCRKGFSGIPSAALSLNGPALSIHISGFFAA